MLNVFITGTSSGLGHGFAKHFLEQGDSVYGLSRRGCHDLDGELHDELHDIQCDLSDMDGINVALDSLLGEVTSLDLVILNAGILGEIKDLSETSLEAIREVMDINVWANKVILDWLLANKVVVEQIVLISSGASVNGNRGWGAYALSKAALNMLTMLYVYEFPGSHLCALAPGLVDTAMQDYLCDEGKVDKNRYPAIMNLRNARGTEVMPGPDDAAVQIASLFAKMKQHPSGSYLDIRTL